MSQRNADVMLHIDEPLSEQALHYVEETVADDRGVVRVGHNPLRPHLLMVDFDARLIHASDVLERVKRQGLHAQLVGF